MSKRIYEAETWGARQKALGETYRCACGRTTSTEPNPERKCSTCSGPRGLLSSRVGAVPAGRAPLGESTSPGPSLLEAFMQSVKEAEQLREWNRRTRTGTFRIFSGPVGPPRAARPGGWSI